MQNSDSGTSIKLNPGDRVRIAHSPKHDREYDANEAPKRAPLHGLAGKIRERQTGHGLCFRVVVDDGRGAWFEADELSPIVTDADGCEVGAPAAPFDVLDAAVQQALAAARREAQGWHSAALLARGEAEGAWAHVRSVEAGLDALRGKLGAANAEVEEAVAALHREREVRQAAEERLAAECSAHEASALGAVKLARRLADVGAAWGRMRAFLLALPRPLGAAGIEGVDAVDKALGGVVVAEHPLTALRRASFDVVRAVLVGLGATVEADNRAGSFTATLPAAVPIEALMWLQSTLTETLPGDVRLVVKGPAVAEQKAGPAWATEGDPWRAKIEARLGRLEEHAPRCAKPTPDGWSCILMPGHAHPNDHHSGRP